MYRRHLVCLFVFDLQFASDLGITQLTILSIVSTFNVFHLKNTTINHNTTKVYSLVSSVFASAAARAALHVQLACAACSSDENDLAAPIWESSQRHSSTCSLFFFILVCISTAYCIHDPRSDANWRSNKHTRRQRDICLCGMQLCMSYCLHSYPITCTSRRRRPSSLSYKVLSQLVQMGTLYLLS